jgi:hypothetical protein
MGETRPRFRASFTDAWFRADLRLLTAAEREAAENARRNAERHGVAAADLERCDPEARDGTSLEGCLRQYLGDLRLIYLGAIGADRGRICSASPSASATAHAAIAVPTPTGSPTGACTAAGSR